MSSPYYPRIVVIDLYDSYTNNLVTLLSPDYPIKAHIAIIRGDEFGWDEFRDRVLPCVDGVVISPGPGRSDRKEDFSFCADLIRHVPSPSLPILGVCLGMQGLSTSFGGSLLTTPRIAHGQVQRVRHTGRGLFAGLDKDVEVEMVRYNSLVVDPDTIPPELEITAVDASSSRNVLGLQHRTRPLHGVQFHPESISSTHGAHLLANFLKLCTPRTSDSKPLPDWLLARSALAHPELGPSPAAAKEAEGPIWEVRSLELGEVGKELDTRTVFEGLVRKWAKKEGGVGEVWLDSARPSDPHSLTSYLSAPSLSLSYNLSTRTLHTSSSSSPIPLPPSHKTFWSYLDALQLELERHTRFSGSASEREGFKCGWVGVLGYEIGREAMDGYHPRTAGLNDDGAHPPDVMLHFCDRVLLYSHLTRRWTAHALVRLRPAPSSSDHILPTLGLSSSAASSWLSSLPHLLSSLVSAHSDANLPPLPDFTPGTSRKSYLNSISTARQQIALGESYELCLTNSFTSSLPPPLAASSHDHYPLYLTLRAQNPAPYSAFLSFPALGNTSVLSSSPERFIRFSAAGHVEMKPIKGTVARGRTEEEDRERMRELEMDVKERAENLMIVDLIRSDLLSFCEPPTVKVPKLIQLESYEAVHQLVTTVVGARKPGVGVVEAVRRCFPPGSMTGAPKLRSVQILEELEEGRRRGVYSGTLGYLSVTGSSDFSVVIRTIVAHGSELSIGAGGAITWLSDAEKEWDEVLTKVGSVLGRRPEPQGAADAGRT